MTMTNFIVEKARTLQGHKDCVYALAPAAQPHNCYAAGGDGMIVRWSLDSDEPGKVIAKVPTSVYALCYNPHREQLIVGQNYEGIHLIDLAAKRERRSLRLGKGAIFDIQQHNHHILVATEHGELVVVDEDTMTVRQQVQPTQQRARSVAINVTTNEVAVGYSDHCIRIYDANTYQLKQTLSGHANSVFIVKYTPDGQFLVSAGRDAHLRFWDVRENYQLTQSIVAHMYAINHLDFSGDGRFFATGSMDKAVKVWDSEEHRLLKVIDKARHAGHGTSVNRVLWRPTPPGQPLVLVSAGDDRTVSVWHLQEVSRSTEERH